MIFDYIEQKTGKKPIIDIANGEPSPFNVYHEKTFSINMEKSKKLGFRVSTLDSWFWKLLDSLIERALREK